MTRTRGFTLIELLVVIAIIGLLSSIVLASLNTARAKARDAQRVSDMRLLQTALNLYYSDTNTYPNTNGQPRSECSAWGAPSGINSVAPGLVPTYTPRFPTDPAMNAASNLNCYVYLSNGTYYKLIDFNIVDSPNPGSQSTLVDPSRNYGQPYARPAGCPGNTETTKAFAIYSDPSAMCL